MSLPCKAILQSNLLAKGNLPFKIVPERKSDNCSCFHLLMFTILNCKQATNFLRQIDFLFLIARFLWVKLSSYWAYDCSGARDALLCWDCNAALYSRMYSIG